MVRRPPACRVNRAEEVRERAVRRHGAMPAARSRTAILRWTCRRSPNRGARAPVPSRRGSEPRSRRLRSPSQAPPGTRRSSSAVETTTNRRPESADGRVSGNGGSGIRTHGGSHLTCFQDRLLKPLGHPSPGHRHSSGRPAPGQRQPRSGSRDSRSQRPPSKRTVRPDRTDSWTASSRITPRRASSGFTASSAEPSSTSATFR